MKKLVLSLVVGSMMMAQPVSAVSITELQAQINILMQIVQQLVEQIANLPVTPVEPEPPIIGKPPIVEPPVYCTREYRPVCGQPRGCSPCPEGVYCAAVCTEQLPQTYSNKCELDKAGARYLYDGVCQGTRPTNSPPVIDSIEGPTSVIAGEKAKWSVKAHDVDGDKLTYKVRWGDELWLQGTSLWGNALPWYGGSQEAGWEHTYKTEGRYTINVSVSDGQGYTTNSYITVFVRAPYNDGISGSCKSWYDGCNTCGRSYPGGPARCTLRACTPESTEKPYCKEYFNN